MSDNAQLLNAEAHKRSRLLNCEGQTHLHHEAPNGAVYWRCKNCMNVITVVLPEYQHDYLAVAPDYCSTRCARQDAKKQAKSTYRPQGQLSIFEVEGV